MMNKKSLTIIVIALIVIVIAIFIFDFTRNSPGKRGANPYELNIEEIATVDKDLIHYKETKNIPLESQKALAMDVLNNEIFLAGDNFIMVLQPDGIKKTFFEVDGQCRCINATDKFIIAGFKNSVSVFDYSGKIINSWKIENERTVITSIAVKEDWIFIADAGNRRVLKYNFGGELLKEFEGKRDGTAGHGFIVPSAHFDLVVNNDAELWIVNPGEHAIENYSDDGELRGYWLKNSIDEDGFSGCCNPAEIGVLEDGSFITSEKGLVRIKIYDASGRLLSVVAPPEKFAEQGQAPEIAADKNGVIYALDFDRNTIRLFEKK
jgi:hypothetical protein